MRVAAALERERGDHGLDRRARRVEALRRAVDERAAGAPGSEPCTARLGSKLGQDALTSTRPVRGSSAKTAPGLPVAASALMAARCAAGMQRELHVVADHRAAGQRVQLALERAAEIGVRADEVVVGRALDAGAAVGRRRVAHDVREHLARRVAALVDAPPVGGLAGAVDRELGAVGGQDQPALDRELLHDLVGVVAARRQRRLRPQLPVGREPEQQHEAPGEHGVDASDRAIHACASRRARSEIAHSNASATQFATSDDPP